MSQLSLQHESSYWKIKLMDWQEKANEFAAAVLLALGAALIAFFKKLPKYLREKKKAKELKAAVELQFAAVKVGNKINRIIDSLGNSTGALYVHIIRYHNGGDAVKPGKGLNITVEWEEPGKPCSGCVDKCSFYNKVPRIQHEWKGQPVVGNWFDIVDHTLNHKDGVTTYSIEEMDSAHQDVWQRVNIHLYKEMFIKHTEMGFYTLGLSFCRRLRNVRNVDGQMIQAVGQLKQLI